MTAINVSTMIAEFFADASQTSLEMPHMTTGQRKHAKKLLDEYSELRCESFGFGSERCLHVFKDSHSDVDAQTQSVSPLTISSFRVKNTFIDDVAPSEEEPIMFRSLQARPPKSGLDVASIVKLCGQKTVDVETDSAPTAGGDTGGDTHPEMLLPLTHDNLQVRNTFIHMRDASADERAVQSMPHGMFKQRLLSEAAEVLQAIYFCDTPTSAGGDAPSFSESDVDVDHIGHSKILNVGALVLVEGLVKVPAYNGRTAVVEAWDEETQRYSILIASTSGCLQAKVKAENLRMIQPCPR